MTFEKPGNYGHCLNNTQVTGHLVAKQDMKWENRR